MNDSSKRYDRTAGLVIIGNEILSGKFADENTPFFIEELRALGVRLRHVAIVEDELDAIVRDVSYARQHFDHVFTTGGIGPTHDDVTMEAIARTFGVTLEPHPELVAALGHLPAEKQRALAPLTRVPAGATLLWDTQSTWPLVTMHNVWIFPGVPRFIQRRFPALRDRLKCTPFVSSALYLSVVESDVVAALDSVVQAFPDVEFGSYPRFGDEDHRTRLTIDGRDKLTVTEAFLALKQALPIDAIVRETPPAG
ncbi:MAG: molybdopterin-binding protein [Myxococcota bacterium]|nr:molybdopterin-binding protein [Myxococcota bacterium]